MIAPIQPNRPVRAARWLVLAVMACLSGEPSARQACTPQTITRLGGAGPSDTRTPALSADGRYAAFTSSASDLDGDVVSDIFVYDRTTCTMEVISVSSEEVKGLSNSRRPSISDDGRFVAFESTSNNLVAPDVNLNANEVFVRDRVLGVTTMASLDSSGAQPVSGSSTEPEISGNGQFVTFVSTATTLGPGDTNGETDVFVRDLVTGTTERVSLTAGGAEGDSATNQGVSDPSISADGRSVAFVSWMTNLVAGDNSNGPDVFVRDRQAGTTVRASITSAGIDLFGQPSTPTVTADGAQVFFLAFENYVPGNTTCSGVFVRNLIANTTSCPALNPTSSTASGPSPGHLAASASGRYIAWLSGASYHVPGDTPGTDAFIHDRTTGATRLVSTSLYGAPDNPEHSVSDTIAISDDGAFVGFVSFAGNLTPGDTNGTNDVFVTRWDQLSVTPQIDLMRDGTFALGLQLWQTFATPNLSYIVANTFGGVLQFYRVPSGTPNQAVVFQSTGAQLFAHAPLEARFRLGNSSSVRKRISVLIHDADFSDLSVCTFWLAPAAPPRDYVMRTHTTEFWSNATIAFYAATAGNDGGFYLVDNVSLVYQPALDDDAVDCIDPTAPVAPGGAPGATLLTNGDFSAGLAPWTTFGQITWQIAGGLFEFFRPVGTPAGVVLQPTGQTIALREILTATLYLGNSSSVRKRVTALLHDSDFSDLAACTFWLRPQMPLAPYVMRTFTTRAWANATISVYPSTVGDDTWIRLDGVTLQRTPGHAPLGTECLEPGANAHLLAARGLALPTARTTRAPVSVPPAAPKRAADRAGGSAESRARWQRTLDLGEASAVRLTFESRFFTDEPAMEIQISLDGVTWTTIALVPFNDWTILTLDLSAYAGEIVHLRLVSGADR